MNIDWSSFTPHAALAGGALIGLAASVYLVFTGRIAGITGLLASPMAALALRRPMRPERSRLLFVLGLVLAPSAWLWMAPLPSAPLGTSDAVLVLAGLLVGVGTRLANGCTSGHGVCGLARLSGRSLANVLVFMSAGMATVFVVRHLLPGA